MTDYEQAIRDELETQEEKMNEPKTKESAGDLVEMEPTNLPAPAITPMQMLQIAVEKGADLDQMQKLMDLNDRWEANQARKAFVSALTAFKADPPRITKNKHVKFGGTEYDHATLDQVCDVVGAALAVQGLSHTWEIDQHENAAVEVTCILTHEQGHSERVKMRGMPDDSGSKNSIQQIGSTTTYLQRYTLLAATGLAAADQNGDGETKPARQGNLDGGEAWGGPLTKTAFKKAMQEFDTDLNACTDLNEFTALQEASKELLDQCIRCAPSWWDTKSGSDVKGFKERIDMKQTELEKAEDTYRDAGLGKDGGMVP